MVGGWKEKSNLSIDDLLNLYDSSEIKGYVITDVKNDGMLKGLNIDFLHKLSKNIETQTNKDKTIIIAGGLTNYDDLKELKKLNLKNVDGVISGKSFYEGKIDLTKAQEILNKNG